MNRNFNILLMVTVLVFTNANRLNAQQSPQFGFYMFNPLALNPAYAGTKDYLSVNLLHRSQWLGFDGAPMTQSLTFQMPFSNNNLGIGFSAINDKIGSTNTTWINADIAYKIRLNKRNDYLSFGIKGGIDIFNSNYISRITFDQGDEVQYNSVANKINPNIGAGIYLYNENYYLGFTVPRILPSSLSTISLNSKLTQHYYLIGGYVFNLSKSLDFKPSVAAKLTMNSPVSIDVNATFIINQSFFIGAMYRVNNAVGANFLVYFAKNFKFGYVFEYSTNDLRKYNYGSHEIILGIDIYTKKTGFSRRQYLNPSKDGNKFKSGRTF